jgi:hypothetical protein
MIDRRWYLLDGGRAVKRLFILLLVENNITRRDYLRIGFFTSSSRYCRFAPKDGTSVASIS